MNKPEIESSITVAEIKNHDGNPRNSEGDFAVLKDGSILFAYSRYSGESAHDDAACDIAGMISADGGDSFTHLPYLLAKASDHNVRNIMSVTLRRLKDGTLCLFYLVKINKLSEYWMRRANEDEKSFGEPERLIPLRDNTYYVINNCRVCALDDGSFLIPAAHHEYRDGCSSYFSYSDIFHLSSDGKKCKLIEKAEMHNPAHSKTGLQEPGAIVLPDRRVYYYFRTDRAFQFESFADESGKNVTEPVASMFSSPESPMLIVRNQYTGIYYSFRNPIPNYEGRFAPDAPWITAGRTPFVFSQSENGVDFGEYTCLETDENYGFCYPAVCFLNEKEFLISYCFGSAAEGTCLNSTRIRKIKLK